MTRWRSFRFPSFVHGRRFPGARFTKCGRGASDRNSSRPGRRSESHAGPPKIGSSARSRLGVRTRFRNRVKEQKGPPACDRRPPEATQLSSEPHSPFASQSQPTASQGPPDGLRRVGRWLVLGVDTIGKRAACRCDRCGVVRELSVEALDRVVCHCAGRPASERSSYPTFSAALAALEVRGSSKRHQGGGGSP